MIVARRPSPVARRPSPAPSPAPVAIACACGHRLRHRLRLWPSPAPVAIACACGHRLRLWPSPAPVAIACACGHRLRLWPSPSEKKARMRGLESADRMLADNKAASIAFCRSLSVQRNNDILRFDVSDIRVITADTL